jgi:hypothetical protein
VEHCRLSSITEFRVIRRASSYRRDGCIRVPVDGINPTLSLPLKLVRRCSGRARRTAHSTFRAAPSRSSGCPHRHYEVEAADDQMDARIDRAGRFDDLVNAGM